MEVLLNAMNISGLNYLICKYYDKYDDVLFIDIVYVRSTKLRTKFFNKKGKCFMVIKTCTRIVNFKRASALRF